MRTLYLSKSARNARSSPSRVPRGLAVAAPCPGMTVAADAGERGTAPRVCELAPAAQVAPSKPNAAALKAATVYRHRFRDAKPINFGKTSPGDMAVHGVDVSRFRFG